MKIFTSDLHHAHKNICKFTDRHLVVSNEEHDDWLVNVWNTNVTNGDVVYHLGDLSFAKHYDDVAEFVSKLNGTKILIKGNHDRTEHLDRLLADKLIAKWTHYEEIKMQETKVCLFHFPIASWHQQSRDSIHLHGHSHGNFKNPKGKMLDIGLDSSYNFFGEHRFFDEVWLMFYMSHIQTHVADQHRSY